MNKRSTIVSIISVIVVATIGIAWSTLKPPIKDTSVQVGINSTFTSAELGMTFTYPSSWRRDTSQEFQKYLTVTSTTPNLNQQSTIGAVSVNSVGKNPKRLDPTTWFNVELSQNVESFTRVGLGKVRSYTTYTIIASELQSMRHIYIFSGTKVIEVSYPNDQIQFTSTYNDIVNSIQIR